MASYVWEWGIDWDEFGATALGPYQLADGLVRTEPSMAVASPWQIEVGDTITVIIFDVTVSGEQEVGAIEAVPTGGTPFISATLAEPPGTPLSPLSAQPTFGAQDNPTAVSAYFGGFANASWTALSPLTVSVPVAEVPLRLLLDFSVTATGRDLTTRTYGHDPEMVVGPGG